MSLFGSFFGTAKKHKADSIDTALDMVTYAASLASNPDAIDPLLDRVRVISASLSPGQVPSTRDTEVLFDVYLHIESYLTTKEVLRTFTTQNLRVQFTPELRQRLEAYINNNKGT